jgi:hypothetical protein
MISVVLTDMLLRRHCEAESAEAEAIQAYS